jgi:DNA integrity scanning protein DisA with diadenylate cyclase activity
MAVRIDEGLKAITATRALVSATPTAMAISMEAMTPWHQLVIEVWGLAARVSEANAKNLL